jgi:glycosyltransferase involved in cell wall biosynthesis
MKIAMISRYPKNPEKPRGGVESVTVILARALAELDENGVEVVTLEREKDQLGEYQMGGARIRRLLRSNWPLILDINIGPSRRRLVAALNQTRPTIAHFHETWGLGSVPTLCPQIFTVHGFDSANLPAEGGRFSWIRSKLWKMAEMKGFAKARHIISISPYVTRQIRPYTQGTIHEIDNPVDSSFFSLERKEEEGRVLCVGWVNPRKNTLMTVRAFARCFRSGKARRLIIAGTSRDQTYLASVQNEIIRENLADAVTFSGQINREQLKAELSRASVLLLPSLQENAPMAISEAMAAGVPVIASNRCGMPYMVADGKSGFLVDPTDLAAIEERLEMLLGNSALRFNMSAKCREIAKARFHPKTVAEKTMSAYHDAIDKEKAAFPERLNAGAMLSYR